MAEPNPNVTVMEAAERAKEAGFSMQEFVEDSARRFGMEVDDFLSMPVETTVRDLMAKQSTPPPQEDVSLPEPDQSPAGLEDMDVGGRAGVFGRPARITEAGEHVLGSVPGFIRRTVSDTAAREIAQLGEAEQKGQEIAQDISSQVDVGGLFPSPAGRVVRGVGKVPVGLGVEAPGGGPTTPTLAPTTKAAGEGIIRTVGRLPGIAAGVATEAGKTVLDVAETAGKVQAAEQTSETFEEFEKKLEDIPTLPEDSAAVAAFRDTEEMFRGRLGGAYTQNLRDDLADQITGLAALGSFIIGGMPTPGEQAAEGPVDLAVESAKAGFQFGRQLVGGAVGGTAAILASPLESLEAAPASTILTFAGPLWKAGKAGAVAGGKGLRTYVAPHIPDSLKGVADKVRSRGREIIVGLIPEAVRLDAAELAVLADRLLNDPNATLSTPVRELLDQVTTEARRVESEIRAVGERTANRVRAGAVDEGPGAIVVPAEELTIQQYLDEGLPKRTDQPFVTVPESGRVRRVGVEDYSESLPETLAQERAGLSSVDTPPVQEFAVETALTTQVGLSKMLDDLARLTGEDNIGLMRNKLDEVLTAELPSVLRAPKLRKRIINDLDKIAKDQGLTRSQRRALAGSIDEALDTLDPLMEREGAVIRIGDKDVNLMEEVVSKALEDPKTRQDVLAAALEKHVAERATARRQASIKDALEPHIMEARAQAQGTMFAPTEVAQRLLMKGDDPPPIMGVDPGVLSRQAVAIADKFGDVAPNLKRVTHHLNKYERMDPDVRAHLGIGGNDPLWVHKDFNNALGMEIRVNKALTAQGGWQHFNRMIKANLTARNPASLLNNINANVVLQTLRSGNPLTPIDVFRVAQRYKRFKKGDAGVSPADARRFKLLDAAGVADANLVAAELGVSKSLMQSLGDVSPKIASRALEYISNGKVNKALDLLQDELGKLGISRKIDIGSETVGRVNKALESVYKDSDNWFRIHEAEKVMKTLEEDVASLQPGEYLTIEVGPGRKVRIDNKAVDGPGGTIRRGDITITDTLTGKEIPYNAATSGKVIAQSAVHHANKLFFDYASKPGLVRLIEGAPILGIGSPFLTWSVKALRLPFEAFRSTPVTKTNSVRILGREAAQSTAAAVRRTALVQATQTQLRDSPADIRRYLQYAPEAAGTLLLDVAFNPAGVPFARTKSTEAISFFSPLDVVLRGVVQAEIALRDLDEVDPGITADLTPTTQKTLQLRRAIEAGKVDPNSLSYKDIQPLINEDERDLPPDVQRTAVLRRLTLDPTPEIFLLSEEDLKLLDPKKAQAIRNRQDLVARFESVEGPKMKDGLAFIGMAGGPILDAWEILQKEGDPREGVSTGELFRRLTPAFMAGWAAKSSDVAIGTFDPLSPMSSRQFAMGRVDGTMIPPEDALDWAIRKYTGIGFSSRDMLKDIDRYYDKVEKAWTETLVGNLLDRAKAAKRAGIIDDMSVIQPEINMAERRVKRIVGRMRQDAYDTRKKLGLGKKPKANAP